MALIIRFIKSDVFKKTDKKKKNSPTKKAKHSGSLSVLRVKSGIMKGATIPLSKNGITIGRNVNSTLVINDSYVSYNHARIFLHNNSWYVEDLGSTNGTLVNSKKLIGAQKITNEDEIIIGENVIYLM